MKQNLRTFYILIVTQTFSQIGSKISGLALGIYIFHQTGQVTPLALVSLFSFLPQVVAAGFAGALADRWDRRLVMNIADGGQALGSLLLLILFLSGAFQVWMLYVIVFLQAIFGVFQAPAFSASVTMLIPDNQRDRANAIQQLTGPSAGVIAPAVAGLLYALIGVAGTIAFDLVSFIVAIIVVYLSKIPRPPQTEIGKQMQGSLLKESFGGLQFLWQWRTLLALMLESALINFLFSGATILFTPYILARTGSEATLGTLLSILDLGAIIGGVIIGVWGGTKPRIHTILPAIIIGGAFLAVIGLAQSPVVMALAMFLMMLPLPMANAVSMSLMQAKVPPDIQGRVFAATGQMAMVLIPLSYLLIGPLSDQVVEPAVGKAGWQTVAPLVGSSAGSGYALLILIAGVIVAISSALVYAIPRIRRMEFELPDYVAQPAETKIEAVELAA
ncbi:MAG TPA: MFS transporter [Phototrophicaceae bacterium]|nr:MFS transporter [Phototrophicaceae bacterium]